jgi:MmyB-like transcription regulator ligand binding domain
MVAPLRTQAGRDPSDRGLGDLIGELATRSDGFAARWARHEVGLHRTARKRLGNRVVGEIERTGDALDLAAAGLTMIAYSAASGSQADD